VKIGYPCVNTGIGCTASSTFRIDSYSEEKLIETVEKNLNCLEKILEFNVKHNLLFFRISSKTIPFASHPICTFDWEKFFKKRFEKIGDYIKKHNFRISMHPDQFVLINAKEDRIVKNSIRELEYHCKLLDLMKLDKTAKVQLHVGGVYGDKKASIERFVNRYKKLTDFVKKRLVIENDERSFSLADCLEISKQTGIPVLFDTFHHECFNNGESFFQALSLASKTWEKTDGIPMIDYSSQDPEKRKGAHCQSINIEKFKNFIRETKSIDFDIMLEIKDKEKSAIKASRALKLV
jgi:UV DNA damage endonuclease